LPWAHRADVFRSAGAPILVFLAGALAYHLSAAYGSHPWAWTFTLYNLAAISWLAITVHRLVLLELPGSATNFDVPALRRLGIFLLATLVVWVIYHGFRLLLMGGVVAILGSRYVPASETPPALELPVSLATIDNVVSVLAWIVLGRVSLVFPAIATDQRPTLVEVWRASRGNSWRLAIVAGALPWCLELMIDLLYRDGATSIETALLLLAMSIFIIVEVVALSLSYRELTAPAPPPSDPLA
jgi:hypothetical protein